jgi:hypothetical protein
MKISFGTLWLASGGTEGAQGLTLNGQQCNDEAQFFRALASTFYGRGNRSASVGFTVNRQLASIHASERFLLTHFWDLPLQDNLRLYCGPDSDQEVILFTGAVIDQIQPGPTSGISLPIRYGFKVSSPQTEVSPPTLLEPTSDMIKRGVAAISSGADHVDVVFSVAFATTPIVVASIQRPAGGDALWPIIRDSSVTVSGFTADLSAPTSAATYKLSWIACG